MTDPVKPVETAVEQAAKTVAGEAAGAAEGAVKSNPKTMIYIVLGLAAVVAMLFLTKVL